MALGNDRSHDSLAIKRHESFLGIHDTRCREYLVSRMGIDRVGAERV